MFLSVLFLVWVSGYIVTLLGNAGRLALAMRTSEIRNLERRVAKYQVFLLYGLVWLVTVRPMFWPVEMLYKAYTKLINRYRTAKLRKLMRQNRVTIGDASDVEVLQDLLDELINLIETELEAIDGATDDSS